MVPSGSVRRSVFQSTLPARGATKSRRAHARKGQISIHAPRTGSDHGTPRLTRAGHDFNPRSPHGERHNLELQAGSHLHFNPRSPHGERQAGRARQNGGPHISIHAPRTGSDTRAAVRVTASQSFQSTLPARGATTYEVKPELDHYISIHAPRTGSDAPGRMEDPMIYKFQSTLPARGATKSMTIAARNLKISIHAPRTGSDSAK